jgi:aspartate/methionine/tyrosine aminotransferase
MSLPNHLDSITSFLAMEVFGRAQELERQGHSILHLEFGEPYVSPPPVVGQLLEQVSNKHFGYTDTCGIAELREAVAERHTRLYQTPVRPEQVLISNGTSPLLFLALRLVAPLGSDILLTDPGYACYDNLILMAGLNPVRVPLFLEDGFQLKPEVVQQCLTKNTKAILLNSPMNPTGTVLDEAAMRGIAELGLPVISDEIYLDLSYDAEPLSYLRFSQNALILHGLSKSYGMTGWRMGYLILPDEWMSTAIRMHQNLMISANMLMQEVALAVLQDDGGALQRNQQEFRQRRDIFLQTLRDYGLDPGYAPSGAFYVFYQYKRAISSLEMAIQILEKTGVALTPGSDFGPGGEGFLRFSYANNPSVLTEAVKRLAQSRLLDA